MTPTPLVIEHDLDVPAALAWDALTDADLVSGWLGEARIEAVVGGEFLLSWVGAVTGPALSGRITRLSPGSILTLQTDELGELSFELDPREGGFRGTWTALRLTVLPRDGVVERQLSEVDWRRVLGQLDELLRGHPVDWWASRVASEGTTARGLDRA